MSRAKIREPISRQPHLTLDFYPAVGHTQVSVALGWRTAGGGHHSRLALLWLRTSKSDLTGLRADGAIRALCEALVRHLDGPGDPADQVTWRHHSPAHTRPQDMEPPQGHVPGQLALPGT